MHESLAQMKSAGLAFVTKISSFLAQNQMGLIAVALKSSLPAIYTLLSSGEFWSPLRMQHIELKQVGRPKIKARVDSEVLWLF